MKKVLVDIKVKELLNTKFRSDKKEIISYFRKLEQNPNLGDFVFSMAGLYGIVVSFVFGLLTIHGLMKVSRKINFGYFVTGFAVLMMLSILI